MEALLDALANGRLIELVLAVMVVELVGLAVVLRWSGSKLGLLDVFPNLLAGALLLLAVRSAIGSGASPTTAALLALSLPAHIVDLVRRFWSGRRARSSPTQP